MAVKGEGGAGKVYVRQMKGGTGVKHGIGFMIGVDNGKEAILYATGVDTPGPKYMHYPIDYRRGYDLEYFRGLLSERQVIHRRGGQNVIAWEKTYERNEPFDMRNYALAAYRFFNWNFDKIEAALLGKSEEMLVTKAQAERKKRKRIISSGIKI